MLLRPSIVAAIAAVSIAGASYPAQAQPSVTAIDMANFKFMPSQLQLSAGVPTTLQLKNDASGGHNFSAPAFFAAARIDPASASLIRNGTVEVPAHSTVQVTLTPAAGEYPLHCSHPFHAAFGMKGTIFVR
jgi:plastocyanin